MDISKNSHTVHNVRINERAFHQINNGEKKIEGRLASNFFSKLEVGHEIIFNCKENKVKRYVQKDQLL